MNPKDFKAILEAVPDLTYDQRAALTFELSRLDIVTSRPSTNLIDKQLTTPQERAKKMRERDLDMATRILHKSADVEIETTYIFTAVIGGRLSDSQTHIRKMLRRRAGKLAKAVLDYQEEMSIWGQSDPTEMSEFFVQLIECVRQAVNKNNTAPIIAFVETHGEKWIRTLLRKWKPRKGKPYDPGSLALAQAFTDIYQSGRTGLKQEEALKQAYIKLGITQDESAIDSDLRKIRRINQKSGH